MSVARRLVASSPLFSTEAERDFLQEEGKSIRENQEQLEEIIAELNESQIGSRTIAWNDEKSLAENINTNLEAYLKDPSVRITEKKEQSIQAILDVVRGSLPSAMAFR